VKGKKVLKKLSDVPIKTLKGRASALCNHFYALVQAGGNMDVLGAMEEPASPPQSHSPNSMAHSPYPHLSQPLISSIHHIPVPAMPSLGQA